MKIVLLTALFAAVAFGHLNSQPEENQTQWPWQVGKLYRYDVQSYNLARLPEGASSGNAFRASFVIRVKSPGQLLAKLENPEHAQVHQELPDRNRRRLPENLKYEPVKNLDVPFNIRVEGGRVVALTMPSTLSLSNENLLKGLISTLQVDLSTYRTPHDSQNYYDENTHQGQFKKMESDVTGECSTLYTVTPVESEWRRELNNLSLTEEPILITKSKNYGHCHHRVSYHFGVPFGAEWTGTADKPWKEQFISRAANSRILAGKQGPIFKAETTNTIYVHPYVYGKQKAEVLSNTKLRLVSFESDSEPEWEVVKDARSIQSLIYSMTTKQMPTRDMSEESNEEDVKVSSSRSASMYKKIVSINKNIVINKHNKYVEGEDSSSADSTSAFVNDEDFDINEPAYAALYMNPQTHKVYKHNPTNAQKLVQELTQLLQKVANMPKSDFLSKFNILVRIIAAMNSEQLTQTTLNIEAMKAANEAVKADMWMIYRDAVAQAGTLPAFKQIVSWIQTKKIRGEEAAEVVSSLVNTLRYPTKSVMKQFFELAMSPEVTEQQFLYSTALNAATRFINMGQVNNYTAHSFYPTHMYGRLSRKHDNFVQEEILPRLHRALEQAIEQQDSRKAQMYIKAIGNLGHRSILEVFAPYLQGQIPASTHLRALMVDNLFILTVEKDSYTRAVLYNILRNPAEPYEVRVAAIHKIFPANPTTEMMQAMAQMTHDDSSIQVRSAIKNGIESAAKELSSPRYLEIARTAQAALPMLTKEEFGQQYSSKRHSDYIESDYEHGIMQVLSTIGSENNMFPKYLQYFKQRQSNGWDAVTSSVSNVQRLIEIFEKYMDKKVSSEKQSNHAYSASKVSEMLNIKRDPQDPLEANLYLDLWNQPRYFSFSEQDLNELPVAMEKLLSQLKGAGMHYTKVFNQAQISVMFPMSSGMPFIYKYKEPTAVHIQAKVNDFSKYDRTAQSAALKTEIDFTYARNIDGSVGFLDTLSNQIASVGFVNKMQLNVPVKVDYTMNKGEQKIHLQQLRPEQDTMLAHYSVWPYSTIQKKDTLVPISLDPATKLITRTNKVISMNANLNPQYQFEGYSYSSDYNMDKIRELRSSNILSRITKAVYQTDVASTHFNLKYRGNKRPNPGVTFTAAYDSLYDLKETEEKQDAPLTASKVEDVLPNSPARRADIVKRVAAGINAAKAQVIDLSATYAEDSFVFTAAIADSLVDPKIQYAFFANVMSNNLKLKKQVSGVGKVNKPESIALNAEQALQKERNINFETDIRFYDIDAQSPQNNFIHIQGKTERTKEYTNALKDLPWAKKCSEQMKRNNNYQEECHKMIIMAQAPDQMNIKVSYNDVSPQAWSALLQIYNNFIQNTEEDQEVLMLNYASLMRDRQFEIKIRNNYFDNIMSVYLGAYRILRSPMSRVAAYALSTYQPIKSYERVANFYTGHLFQPFCTVDGDQIRTFSGRSYRYVLSPAWHVVMQDAPKEESWQDELVVLSRKPSEQQQEVYISYQSETGQDLEIEIKPSTDKHSVNVKTNSKKVSEGELTTYWDEVEQKPLLQYYNLPDGVLMLNIRENRLRAMYDGQRLVVLTRNGRNNIRGICGRMSGDVRDDYWSPEGLVDSDEQFGVSYALNENSEVKTKRLEALSRPWMTPYQRLNRYTNILKSDSQWQKWQNEDSSESSDDWSSQKVYRTRSHVKQPRGTCVLTKQVQYYETSSHICVTTKPLASCPSHCKGEGYTVQLEPVVCSSTKDLKFQEYVDEITRGQNPTVTGSSEMKQYRIPSSCRV